jgi:DNA polymerase (family 10)
MFRNPPRGFDLPSGCIRALHSDMSRRVSNGEIADKLSGLAHLLATRKENPFKIKAYRRAARTIRALGESVAELVHSNADLTRYSGIGPAISGVICELVKTGSTRRFQELQSQITPELAGVLDFPLLDPKRVLRIYKKLKISTIGELKERLETGEIGRVMGPGMDQHVRRALSDHTEMLLHEADRTVAAVHEFLIERCRVTRAEAAGDFRRRVDVIQELHFLVETSSFPAVVATLQTYGGNGEILESSEDSALFKLSTGRLRVTAAPGERWGLALLAATGSPRHLHKLESHGPGLSALLQSTGRYPSETNVYAKLGLRFIPPELREGGSEVELSARAQLPELLTVQDIRGELHAHTTSSDGVDTIEAMAEAARARGLSYIGISDHSQSLKIARGLSISRLGNQLRFIETLNGRLEGIRILKSAEVDILEDGSLDYPDDLLKELDYTICSVHSRFGLDKEKQTTRILRAMDNRHFSILGHATGRLLLKRPGYEIDFGRLIEHARARGCFFELNSNPNRLDLSSEHARMASEAGVRIAVNTDAHSTRELGFIKYGVDNARRAGLEKQSTLNTLAWPELVRVLRR